MKEFPFLSILHNGRYLSEYWKEIKKGKHFTCSVLRTSEREAMFSMSRGPHNSSSLLPLALVFSIAILSLAWLHPAVRACVTSALCPRRAISASLSSNSPKRVSVSWARLNLWIYSPGSSCAALGGSAVSGSPVSQVGDERLWAEKISGPGNPLTQMSKWQLMSEWMKKEMLHDHKSQYTVGEDDKYGYVFIVSYPVSSYDFSNFWLFCRGRWAAASVACQELESILSSHK